MNHQLRCQILLLSMCKSEEEYQSILFCKHASYFCYVILHFRRNWQTSSVCQNKWQKNTTCTIVTSATHSSGEKKHSHTMWRHVTDIFVRCVERHSTANRHLAYIWGRTVLLKDFLVNFAPKHIQENQTVIVILNIVNHIESMIMSFHFVNGSSG